MKLRHEDGENYRSSYVTVHYDNKIDNLAVDDQGIVEVTNKLQAEELQKSHGAFTVIEEDDLPDYVLADLNVSEVEGYVRDMEDLERLKELRELESEGKNRKMAVSHIDDRIAEVKENIEVEEEPSEEVEDETGENENSGEDEAEDGEEAEDE